MTRPYTVVSCFPPSVRMVCLVVQLPEDADLENPEFLIYLNDIVGIKVCKHEGADNYFDEYMIAPMSRKIEGARVGIYSEDDIEYSDGLCINYTDMPEHNRDTVLIFVCPWSYDEDADRLAPVIERVKKTTLAQRRETLSEKGGR